MKKSVVVIQPAGAVKISADDQERCLDYVRSQGFAVAQHQPRTRGCGGVTAGSDAERAALVSLALTQRRHSVVWCARGGYGTTALVRRLEEMLPPVLPAQIFVGFSDNSFLGNWLSQKYKNLCYLHAPHFFGEAAKNKNADYLKTISLIKGIIDGNNKETAKESVQIHLPKWGDEFNVSSQLSGTLIPFNLSLAESYAALADADLPDDAFLFLEEVNEEPYRILRKLDSLKNARWFSKVKAVVLGDLGELKWAKEDGVSQEDFVQFIAKSLDRVVAVGSFFGHGDRCVPMLAGSSVTLQMAQNLARTHVSWDFVKSAKYHKKTDVEQVVGNELDRQKIIAKKLHFCGIGGTGMAAVAGLFLQEGFQITGSDKPLYAPMSDVIAGLGLKPYLNHLPEHVHTARPDYCIIANILSRGNEELEEILRTNQRLHSFPSALRHHFLNRKKAVVVSGTHGKTTTTSLIAFLLHRLGRNPSYFIGGVPQNFSGGFAVGSGDDFVLEGDEYDTAFFDKGPKFLHYNPSVTLINNIEFDHADIYDSVEDIENEFRLLLELTNQKNGFIVAHLGDVRIQKLLQQGPQSQRIVGFCDEHIFNELPQVLQKYPVWKLKGCKTKSSGTSLQVRTPWEDVLDVQVGGIFGHHNALNALGALGVLHAQSLADGGPLHPGSVADQWVAALAAFGGVKRRFELVGEAKDVFIFDDFAHHPTAIRVTLNAFKEYVTASQRGGRLVVCFEPRSATMRRKVLAQDLSQSFIGAHEVCIGRVFTDARLNRDDVLDGEGVAQCIGAQARAFHDNEVLLTHLTQTLAPGDTVVFMSSGSFDGLPRRLLAALRGQK